MASPPEPLDKPIKGLAAVDAWVLLALLAAAVMALWPVLNAAPEMAPGLPGHDGRTQWYPWRVYGFGALSRGEVPLWNPYILCGTPFLGSFQSGLFYPPNLLFAFAGVAKAARASVVLHVWLSMVFTYFLARMFCRGRAAAAIGAAAFGLCAAQVLRVPAGHWGVSCAIPWLPLAFLAAEWIMRRPTLAAVLLGAGAVALQILSGVPQIVFVTAVATGTYALMRGFGEGWSWRARLGRWAAVAGFFALGAGLSAPQLVPGIEAALNGARSLPMRPAWLKLFSLGPENLATLFLPGLFGGLKNGFYWGRFFYWEMNMYVGIGALALGLTGLAMTRPRRIAMRLGLLALLMLLLALGRHTPVMALLTGLPFGDMLRGPAKFLLPVSLALSLLAALGAEAALKPGRLRGLLLPVGVVAAATLALAIIAETGLPDWQERLYRANESFYAPGEGSVAQTLPITISALQSLAVLGAMVAALIFFRGFPRVLPCVVAAVICLDGIFFSWSFVGPWSTFRAAGSAWPEGAAEALRQAGGGQRALAVGVRELDDAMIERVPAIEGIEPNPPVRFHILFRSGQRMPVDIAPSTYQVHSAAPEFMRMALGRIVGPTQPSEAPTLWQGGGLAVQQLPNAVPRARIVYSQVQVPRGGDAMEVLLATEPREAVVLEEESLLPAAGAPAEGTSAALVEDLPDRVRIAAELERPGWLVLLDNYYPGWRATVDGAPATILRADFAFRAVALPAGKHEVVFTYRPRSLLWGCALGAVSFLGCMCAAVVARRKSRKLSL